MIIITHHRNAELASRKQRQLEKKYNIVRLESRRNSLGHYSKRGRTYVWEVFKKPEVEEIEIVLHFDYGNKEAKNLIQFQVHVIGPATATDAECISAVRAFERGEKPEGWKWKEIFWAHPPRKGKRVEGKEKALRGVRRAAIGTPASVSIVRKNSVPKPRSPKRKAKPKKGVS